MIKVNTCHIGDEPLSVTGTESREILELTDPEMLPVSDIAYALYASKTGQDLLVNGTASFQMETHCARCMKKITVPVKAGKLCLFFEKVPEQEVDLTDDIREELLLAIPDYIHCTDDCKGLCPRCGANLNDETCTCGEDNDTADTVSPEDSPWSALDQLK